MTCPERHLFSAGISLVSTGAFFWVVSVRDFLTSFSALVMSFKPPSEVNVQGMSTLWMVLWVLSASHYFAHNDASVPQQRNFVSFWRQSVWVVWRNVRVHTNTPYAKRSATQVILEIACRVQHSLTNSVATNTKAPKSAIGAQVQQ